MKKSVADVEIAVRNRVFDKNTEAIPVTFDAHTMEDFSGNGLGDLYVQDQAFLQFHTEISGSQRAGPSVVSPTRYFGQLYISYLTKEPSRLDDAKLMEQVANWFAEQTVDGVRFRTFTPYSPTKENGFTQYLGVIDLDFELYRGA